jgi:hexosaminidase
VTVSPPLVPRRTVLRAGVAAGALLLAAPRVHATAADTGTAAAADTGAPRTIPAVRSWQAAGGSLRLCSTARIVVGRGPQAALLRTARQLRDDLLRAGSGSASIKRGKARAGDIVLELAADDRELGSEGYRLTVSDRVVITADAEQGLFYGTRTLLQLLVQEPALRRGTIRDWPTYAQRGLLVDIGRQHFSYDWLVSHIRTLGWLKLNELHLHFTENLGWRIASDGHPEVVSEEHLTKAQVRQLLALAERHHVTLVPELDAPGHMGAALRNHPELQLRNALGRANPNNLDYTLPAARRLLSELVEEYVELFPGPSWHTGADEFLVTVPPVATPADYALYPQLEAYAKQRHGADATAKDGILGLLNDIAEQVAQHGKRMRVWNDGLSGGKAVELDPTVDVEWWTDLDGLRPDDLLARGHRVTNMSWHPTYYINGFPGGFVPGWSNDIPFPNKPRDQDVWNNGWAPHRFHGPLAYQGVTLSPPIELPVAAPGLMGSKIAIFNDGPDAATEGETATGVAPRLRSMAQRTWGTADLVGTYAEFVTLIGQVGDPARSRLAAGC